MRTLGGVARRKEDEELRTLAAGIVTPYRAFSVGIGDFRQNIRKITGEWKRRGHVGTAEPIRRQDRVLSINRQQEAFIHERALRGVPYKVFLLAITTILGVL